MRKTLLILAAAGLASCGSVEHPVLPANILKCVELNNELRSLELESRNASQEQLRLIYREAVRVGGEMKDRKC